MPAADHRYYLCPLLCPPTEQAIPLPNELSGLQKREHTAPGLLALAHHLDKKQLLPRPQNSNPKGSNMHLSHCWLLLSLPCQLRRCRISRKVLVTSKAGDGWVCAVVAKLLRMGERELDNPEASLLWNMLLGPSKQDLLQGKIVRSQAGQMHRQTTHSQSTKHGEEAPLGPPCSSSLNSGPYGQPPSPPYL